MNKKIKGIKASNEDVTELGNSQTPGSNKETLKDGQDGNTAGTPEESSKTSSPIKPTGVPPISRPKRTTTTKNASTPVINGREEGSA